jgi:2-dehydro-3-deoxyphosphogluconate aldolase/(4S)-4-hydroxy-2-oxoglutarate aldolase
MDMFPEELLQRLQAARVVAGFAVERAEDAVPIARELLAGGIDTIELTLRTDAGNEAVRAIHEAVPECFLGVGTILRPDQAIAVKEAGAHFGVAPGMNPRVIQAAQVTGLPFAPGICTPTDLEAAIELGCRVVKFFPAASSGGIPFLKSMAAPYKHLGIRYFPLGGVNADNMMDYLREDIICAVGGSWIVKDDLVKAGDWDGITERAAEVVRTLSSSAG